MVTTRPHRYSLHPFLQTGKFFVFSLWCGKYSLSLMVFTKGWYSWTEPYSILATCPTLQGPIPALWRKLSITCPGFPWASPPWLGQLPLN